LEWSAAVAKHGLCAAALRLAAVFALRCGDGTTRRGQKNLAEESRLCIRGVQRGIKELLRAGFILRNGKIYSLAYPKHDNPVAFCGSENTTILSPSEDTKTRQSCRKNTTILSQNEESILLLEGKQRSKQVRTPDLQSEFLAAWNEIGAPFGTIRRLTPKRMKALKARARDADWLRDWRAGLEAMKQSDFCRGLKGWTANADWFLREDTLTKLLEGAYGGGAGAGAASGLESDYEDTRRVAREIRAAREGQKNV